MELECDISNIQSEELLRKMWQQSEDINRKKEIRSQLYKLRESRLRDLYQFDIMSDNTVSGFGKDHHHGDALADQSFQSLKSKEIRDSMSPTEMKFQSMALNNPSTTGWNVQSSSEVSPDGRGFRAETLASTDGVENINGGTAEFKGRNEQRSSAMHEGDDKNFLKKASESSNTHLQEKVVLGDENSGRTEIRTKSSTSTSSSKVFQSSSTNDYDNVPALDHQYQKYLTDSNRAPQRMQEPEYQQTPTYYEPQHSQEVRSSTDHSNNTQQQYVQQTEQHNTNRHEKNTSQNIQTNETREQNKRYVDMDKASPEYQQHVQHLMSQAGEIISNTVEYPKPNVKMITTVKRLPDGTIVRNKRYETEETSPTCAPSYTNNTRQTTSNQTTDRRDSQTNQPSKNYQGHPPSERMRHPNNDVVDNAETIRYVQDAHRDNVSNVETKYSTVKTSNRKFSTETTSETVKETDDDHFPGSSRPKPVTNDFSTHGFPSVRSNKPTQEFANDRPQTFRPNQGYPSQNMTSPREAVIPTRGEFEPTITERRIPTNDGEVIVVSSEKKRIVKNHTNSERVFETDVRTTDDNRYQQISDVRTTNTNQDFSTHGFPSVREPNSPSKTFPDTSQVKPHADTPGYPSNIRVTSTKNVSTPGPNDDVIVVSSQKSQTSKHSTNSERIIQTEVLGDDGRPRQPTSVGHITNTYTVTTPGDHVPYHEYPASRQSPGREYPTHGYPAAGVPSVRTTNKPGGTPEQPILTQSRPQSTPYSPVKKPNTTVETTERLIRKEKETDLSHRNFAASLRSSSPVDNTRRDSYSTDGPRHTPRSSVSSTKNYKRDMREGSYESTPGSETSRLSTTTVTRKTPPRTVGGRTVVSTTKNNQGPNESVSVTSSTRGTKSPSPGKTVTTTTTVRTVTSKATPKDVPKPDNQHTTTNTTNTTNTKSSNDTIFPINHEPLTITKKIISDNQSNSKIPHHEVIEKPCLKKDYYLLGPSDKSKTDHQHEPSPRSSPAPSSRSSPYPSKSKSSQGEDDQSIKPHTSRPLSPTTSSTSPRSPKPIGSRDVSNSRDHPTNVVGSDERRTVDREATFEQIDNTSTTRRKPSAETPTIASTNKYDEVFITEDYTDEENVDAAQILKRKTKQLITHEKDTLHNRGPTAETRYPQEVQRPHTDVNKKPYKQEDAKRPVLNNQTRPVERLTKQPLTPKSNVTPKQPNSNDRKPSTSGQKVPKIAIQSERKPQSPARPDPKPREMPQMKSPFSTRTPHSPRVRSPENRTNNEDEIADNYETTEITIKTTNKDLKKTQKDIEKLTSTPTKPRTEKGPKSTSPKISNVTKTSKPIDSKPNVPQRSSPERAYLHNSEDEQIIENVRETTEVTMETTKQNLKKAPQNIGEYPRTPVKLQANKEPKSTKQPSPVTPRRGSPERSYLSDSKKEPVTKDVHEIAEITIQTSEKKLKKTQKEIDEIIKNEYTTAPIKPVLKSSEPFKKVPKQSDFPRDKEPTNTSNMARSFSPKRDLLLDSEEELVTSNSHATESSSIEVLINETPKRPHVPKRSSPDRSSPTRPGYNPKDYNDRETSEITIQTTKKTQKEIEEFIENENASGQNKMEPAEPLVREPKTAMYPTDETITTLRRDGIEKHTQRDTTTEFIESERTRSELPDGAFISKVPDEPNTSPSYKKKGVSRRDTFEDRCRQILGMETYGDTPGAYKKQPEDEKNTSEVAEKIETSTFHVKIEDCGDDDDEPLSINSVKKNLATKRDSSPEKEMPNKGNPNEPLRKNTNIDESFDRTTEIVYNKNEIIETTSDSETEIIKSNETSHEKPALNILKKPSSASPTGSKTPKDTLYEIDITTVSTSKSPTLSKRHPIKEDSTTGLPKDKGPRDKSPKQTKVYNQPKETEYTTETTKNRYVSDVKMKFTDTTSESEPELLRPKDIPEVSHKYSEKTDFSVSKKPTSKSPEKSVSPSFDSPKRTYYESVEVTNKETEMTRKPTPTKSVATPETPKRKPSKTDSVTKPIGETIPIKDRLRSSTRKEKSPKKPDQVDAGSSPETSPTRHTERRRSSNISVNTEIIIEHTDVESVNKKAQSPSKKPKDSVFKEIIDSTVLPEKLPRKMPVTERKESAPVHRVTRKDKDSKMSRSTSENLIKVVKKPEPSTTLTPPSPKSYKPTADHRRPNKCFSTKTINLSATDRLISSENMENVIIDIQHAKSSREPSPDKIVPTPVPAHLDTGKPRYPDVVQEPEDEPRKKPVIKNIPIFEEEHNTYVGCHITEVNNEKSRKTVHRPDYPEDDLLATPLVEAPLSLDYPTSDKHYPSDVPDDEFLLSVHDKVSKFQHIADEVKKPKSSSPFNREYDDKTHVPDDDECLLTVDEKVDKFIKTAESLTKQPITPTVVRDRLFVDETDEDLEVTECKFTTVKLAPTAPQKSPELVRHISRNLSRQSDVEEPTEEPFDSTTKHTYETHKEYQTKRTEQEHVTHRTSAVKQHQQNYSEPIAVVDNDDDGNDDLIPHTATHTTRLEERRQKNILNRPSVFDNNNSSKPTNKVSKTQPKCVSPEKSTIQPQQQVKTRVKPETSTPLNEGKTSTTITTTTTTTTNKRQQQSPQRRVNPNTDYRSGSKPITPVLSSTTNKQPKPYSTNNGPKKSPNQQHQQQPQSVRVNKKPDRQTPLQHTNKTKNLKHDDDDADDDYVDCEEFEVEVVPTDSETELIINTDTAIRSTTTRQNTGKTNARKDQQPTQHTAPSPTTRKMKEIPIIPSSASSSPTKSTKEHVVSLNERSTLKHLNLTSTNTTNKFSETNESFLENRPPQKTPYAPKPKQQITSTDSVAARRSLFENHNSPSKPSSKRVTPTSSPSGGRRPSYMDHTKSSLEHIRRDSLEVNKTNYSRKPSGGYDDEINPTDRNTQVKFDVPQKMRDDDSSHPQIEEDINIEEIFDLIILERLLETVTSYELRRRIRAQIRIVKKNLVNVERTNTSETRTPTPKTYLRDRSISPDSKNRKTTTSHVTSKKQYSYREEQSENEQRFSSTHTSPERTQIKTTKISRTYSPDPRKPSTSSPHERSTSPQQKPTQVRVGSKPAHHERSPSPKTNVERKEYNMRESVKKQYVYNDHDSEQTHIEEVYKETSPTPRRASRKSVSPETHSSPERQQVDSSRSARVTARSPSPREKKPIQVRVCSRSPENKMSSVHKSNVSYEKSITSKQEKYAPTLEKPKSRPEQKSPVWADRKNVLKSPTTSPRKPSTVTDSKTASVSKTFKSSTNKSQKQSSTNTKTYVEDDCITSSYGIGPTDENGLPLFGIRALKKKKPITEPCETKEEVTGYVIEEKYYSENNSKPIVERKEVIYSTNPEQLNAIKEKVKGSSVRSIKSHRIEDEDEPNPSTYKTSQKVSTTTSRSSPDEFLESSSTKYVRRGSVKEMSEKFIHKESSSSVSEKVNSYPKAGLILRTNSRKQSRENDAMDGDNIEYLETRMLHVDDDNDDDDCLIDDEHIVIGSESESESIKKTQREFKQYSSTKSSSSRSFLNSKAEEKVVTSVDDVLDRMRNADNVVEEGDTAEDQEARALLNKFLGASIIMKGVETAMPGNRATKITTTTTTGSVKQPSKHEVKTTRVTKTIKSGRSSSPVIETTCDIEEIWDEEILKQLLEQAKSYEERRKIRSRLRELMADRAEKKNCQPAGNQAEEEAAESSASEYEEIIEEVTDTDSDDEVEATKPVAKESEPQPQPKESTKVAEEKKPDTTTDRPATPDPLVPTDSCAKTEQTNNTKVDAPTSDSKSEQVTETQKTTDDITDGTSEQGESAMPTPQGSMHQQKMLQANQANSQKLGVTSSTYSKTTSSGGNTSKISSDRSMHVPNNKSSSSAPLSYSSQPNTPPIVTLTAGRTGNNSAISRDIKCSTNLLGDVVSNSSSNSRQVDRLGVPQKEDSGTESGEDLRLIAAGLRDQLQMKSDSNIIDDVTCALSRLETSLIEGKDITVDTEKRKALLGLVGRLQAGLTSPEKLAEIAAAMSELDGNDGIYAETSSPEADAHRSNRQRFGKRRNRIDRHTVGVSREELADARRYMEDMIMMENISHSTTPEAGNNNSPPQWYPLEKNASTGSILGQQPSKQATQFLPENTMHNSLKNRLSPTNNGKRRPVSGDFSVSFFFESSQDHDNPPQVEPPTQVTADKRNTDNGSPDSKFARFSNKKLMMKRANTIDIAKTKKFNSDLDTDSEAEDRSQLIGLKRAIHPSVKKRIPSVVPAFEPKTENDRKFLAFINKQSDKPGLGWTSSRSVSNWTNKFGSLKNSFELGANTAGKPPQVPGHVHGKLYQTQQNKPALPPRDPTYISTNQQIAQRLQQEAERQAEERRRKLEYERLEYERREREKMEHLQQQMQQQQQQQLQQQQLQQQQLQQQQLQQQQLQQQQLQQQVQQQQLQKQCEKLERERLEREYFEKEIRERNKISANQHNGTSPPKPIPINEFKHAPQSVFKPIENGDIQPKGIYRPIPQLPTTVNTWQPPTSVTKNLALSPNNYPQPRPDNSFITSPPPSSKSPIGLPWVAKQAVDSTSFRNKANRFEERSKYDNHSNGPMLQRHNSLRASNVNVAQNDDYKKRPSLPNTTDPFSVQNSYQPNQLPYLPPPINVSFTYNDRTPPKPTYLSYPCLPTAVSEADSYRSREDSLTNPQAVPLVLTSANPTYCPQPQQTSTQQQLPRDLNQPFDIMSPTDSAIASPNIQHVMQSDYTDDDLDSDNLMEYRVTSKVMPKPQSQTAVTVGRRTGHVSDDEVYGKNSRAAKNLLSTMKNIGNNGNGENKRQARTTKRPETATSPKACLSPDGRSYQAPIVEPLFPDLTKFEADRQPMYDKQTKPQQTTAMLPYNQTPSYGQPRKQPTMYKSLENLARRIPPPVLNSSMYVPPQPSPKPYVSETQTAYVVTYPTEDTTDDEDHSRLLYRKNPVPNSLPLRRSRNISETSTASSNTASVTYSNNIPSPNTSWTSNPIVTDEPIVPVGPSFYDGVDRNRNFMNQQQSVSTNFLPRQEDSQMAASKPSPQYQYNQPASPANYINTTPTEYTTQVPETKYPNYPPNYQEPEHIQPSPAATNFKSPSQYTTKAPQTSVNYSQLTTTQSTSYEGSQKKQTTAVAPKPKTKSTPKQQISTPTKKPVAPVPVASQPQRPAVPKTSEYKAPVPQPQKPLQAPVVKPQKSRSPIEIAQEKAAKTQKALADMRKTLSEDYHDVKTVTSVKSQNTKISKDMASTKVVQQQNERITADVRRKSLGSALEYQQMEERRTTAMETQQSQKQMYTSSAPADTPDIVKSSLPKDENQPILKKFGPPQRHHYIPNAYQSPLSKTDKMATTHVSTTAIHTKSVEVTPTKSILKTAQNTIITSKPTIIENPATPQPDDDYIPRNIVFNNIHAFTSMSRRPDDDRSQAEPLVRPNKLSKSDSWNQIVSIQNQHMPTTAHKYAPPANELRRTKSGHSLSIPKMYEAGLDKTEITEKQRTVAAYFSGQKSPVQAEEMYVEQTKRSAINRTKTSEKISASRKSLSTHVAPSHGGLARSATMPHIANLSFLDESNVEDAFEQLMMDTKQQQSSTSTTEKTETKGKDGAVVTTTTKVTTRTVSGAGPKTDSPFAKFKQLDRQNSQQSSKSPTTPTTPGGGTSASPTTRTGNAPIFKFTDPALNARAATVKDQLLQWCQSKTKEYENVQITNFSACWVDGLAFCALIHHFLPDAFDYSQLTPQNRRKNFELAFTVADEKAGIAPLLDVEDMVVMKRPDWKCVFVYVQSIWRRFRNCQ